MIIRVCILAIALVVLSGCASSPPRNTQDLCAIFKEKPQWYKQAKRSAKAWGGTLYVPMAIMHQESRFRAKAKPPMQYFLGIIPTGRASNAYGYSQALKSTWSEYQKDTGSWFKDRDDFADSYDFIQWYTNKTLLRNGVAKTNAYAQYLNYHEGHGGYARGTYKSKQWLINVAQKVAKRSQNYSTQLSQCQDELDKRLRSWFF